jgi:hypothetical protein
VLVLGIGGGELVVVELVVDVEVVEGVVAVVVEVVVL